MRVKSLEVSGFKSFADKTVVLFPAEMCAVVGPNGCGKSNVVDAVRWVLGEQSAKQLRGRSMDDVIFGGAERRKGSGMAEVSLVLENTGSISAAQFADLSEIVVTRRLYRSGESEYLINKVPCRLKDIQQLFMDTGLGNRAYAIIEQGRVSAFVEAKPEKRRLWVEEAAGITRYKSQKAVSLRKMERAQDNLARLDDILHEVNTQMAKLTRQAKKAQRHEDLKKEIRDLDLAIGSHKYQSLMDELREAGAEAEAVGAQLLLAGQRVTGLETDQETVKVQVVGAEQEINASGDKKLATQGAIQKAENELTLIARETQNLLRQRSRAKEDREQISVRLEGTERDLTRAKGVVARLEEALAACQAAEEKARLGLAAHQEDLAGAERGVDRAKAALVENLSAASQSNSRAADLERAQASFLHRREQLSERQSLLEGELSEVSALREAAQAQLAQLQSDLEEFEAALARANGEAGAAQQEILRLCRAEEEAGRKEHQLRAQFEALEMSLASHDWAQPSVRDVLVAANSGDLPVEVLGVAAEKLTVEPGMEAAVEAALGLDLQALLVKDQEAALALASWVDRSGISRVRALALDELAPLAPQPPPGSRALGALITYAPGFQALSALYAGAGIVSGLAEAWATATQMTCGQVVVTEEGQRLDRSGGVVVGKPSSAPILAQRNQLAALGEDMARAQKERQDLSRSLVGAREKAALIQGEKERLQAEQGEAERTLTQQEQKIIRLGESATMKSRQLEGLEFDAAEVYSEEERLRGKLHEAQSLARELGAQRDGLEAALAKAQEDLASKREGVEGAQEAYSQARISIQAQSTRGEHAAQEQERLDLELKTAQESLARLDGEIESADQQERDLTNRKHEEQVSLGEMIQVLEVQEEDHRRARDILAQAQVRLSDLEVSLKQARGEERFVEDQSQKLMLRQRELELNRNMICQRTFESCRVDLTNEYRTHLPQGNFDREPARAKLERLRQRLNRLGPVNLEAISEHGVLVERQTFLSKQRADLESSLEDLRSAIRKINRKSRTRFTSTLEQVNAKLSEVFPVLFGGGTALLALEEGLDPLDAGLHLLVELPGKKVRNLNALSGGEKAMAAAAVLFALFLIRPAPFCILDEVDAPLDEANVSRFHDLLRKLAHRSQIMLITHSRRTMEIMDLLYGVTMEERGVSKLLAVNLKEGQSLAA